MNLKKGNIVKDIRAPKVIERLKREGWAEVEAPKAEKKPEVPKAEK